MNFNVNLIKYFFLKYQKLLIIFAAQGEMAEWSNAVVLKTIVPKGTGGSTPSLSAEKASNYLLFFINFFVYFFSKKTFFRKKLERPIKTSNYSGKNNSKKCNVRKISTLIP